MPLFAKLKQPADHPAFSGLPVDMVTLEHGGLQAAVHVAGALVPGRVPLVCVSGYHRNMSDFADFLPLWRRFAGERPAVLIDLPGRGRSSDRPRAADYGSPRDAHDISQIVMALGIERAVFLGQGYGGQVLMLLAVQHPRLMAGCVLIDAGPVTSPRGIVRLRNNMRYIEGLRGRKQVMVGLRRMLAGDHPGTGDDRLEQLALRTHWLDRRGRARPLYDSALIRVLDTFSLDDVLAAQWPLFDALGPVPLMLLRTQLTDQLLRETFEEMVRRRPDAAALTIVGQGSPALLDEADEVAEIARFAEAASVDKMAA